MSAPAANMLARVPQELVGNFVRLERLQARHAAGLFEVGRDEAVWTWLSRPALQSVDDSLCYIASARETPQGEGPQQAFAAIHLASGRVAGTTRYLDMRPQDRSLEIGWTWYGREFQRTAVNTECKLLLLAHAFEAMGCIRVCFKTDHANERSQRAIERIGAIREGVLRNHRIRRDSTFRHSVFYSIIADEWPTVKARLTALLAVG